MTFLVDFWEGRGGWPRHDENVGIGENDIATGIAATERRYIQASPGSCFDSVSTCRSECWKGREERGGRVDMTRFVSRYKWKVFRFDSLGRIGERLEGLRIRKIFFIGEGKCFVIRILVNHYRVKFVFVC